MLFGLSRERVFWIAGIVTVGVVVYYARGQCDDGTFYAAKRVECPSADAKGLTIALPQVIATIQLWHQMLPKLDENYTPGLWGLTSPSLYRWEKVRFIYEQVDLFVRKGSLNVKHICEVGVMTYDAAVFMHMMAPDAKYWGFDLVGGATDTFFTRFKRKDRTELAWKEFSKWLKPNQGTMTWGKSQETVPQFAREHPEVKCDLILIDGEKSKSGRYNDMRNFEALAHPGTLVLMDEITTLDCVHGRGDEADVCSHADGQTSMGYRKIVQEGRYKIDDCLMPFPRTNDGFCVGHFTFKQ